MNVVALATVFGVIFVAELPDKSLFASLVLGTRYRALYVWVGVAAAFAVHVVLAVVAGGLLTLLPRRVVDVVVVVLFLVGAALMLFGREEDAEAAGYDEAAGVRVAPTFRRVALTSFGVVFVGEWGDITQLATANYAARYDDPLAVGVGAVLALWAVAGLAVTAGARLLDHVPMVSLRRVAGLVLLGFGVASAVTAVRG